MRSSARQAPSRLFVNWLAQTLLPLHSVPPPLKMSTRMIFVLTLLFTLMQMPDHSPCPSHCPCSCPCTSRVNTSQRFKFSFTFQFSAANLCQLIKFNAHCVACCTEKMKSSRLTRIRQGKLFNSNCILRRQGTLIFKHFCSLNKRLTTQ